MYKIEEIINKVHCADCLEFMKLMPDKCVDLVLTDPPYGTGIDYGIDYLDNQENLKKLIDKIMPEFFRISKRVALTCGVTNQFLYPNPSWVLGWFHGGGNASSKWGFSNWQPILVYGEDPYLKNRLGRRPDAYQGNEKQIDYGHPCSKPLNFWKWLLNRCSLENDLILDPFLGSGTTAVAAKQLKRNFIGIEISEKYCSIARQRLRQDLLPI
jgi:DNA modification methylase